MSVVGTMTVLEMGERGGTTKVVEMMSTAGMKVVGTMNTVKMMSVVGLMKVVETMTVEMLNVEGTISAVGTDEHCRDNDSCGDG